MGITFTVIAALLIILGVIGLRSRSKYAKQLAVEINKDSRDLTRLNNKGLKDLQSKKSGALGAAVVLLVLGLFTLVMNSWTMISPRNVGVVDNMGRADRSFGSGPHWVWPWANVKVVDATVQTVSLDTNLEQWTKNKTCTAIAVRLANQSTACVDNTFQWNIDQDGGTANQIWQMYKSDDSDELIAKVQNNVVMRELQRAMNAAFENYNPLGGISDDKKKDDGAAAPSVLNTKLISQIIQDDMTKSLGAGIVVEKLMISIVHYDAITQSKLDAYNQALADTQIATQQVKTAAQQKEANNLLANAAANDPGVMFQNCLNLVRDLAAKNQLDDLPPAFTCPGSGGGNMILQPK